MHRTSRTLFATLAAGCLLSAAAAADPVTAGGAFRLDSCTGCLQHLPAVAGSPAGDFMTVWDGATAGSAEDGVFGRAFKATGVAADAPFEIVQDPQPPQYDGAVAKDAAGNFVLAWGSSGDGQSSILAQRYDPNGAALGPVIEVASAPLSSPDTPTTQKPAVAATPDGGFWVAWIGLPGPNSPGNAPPRVLAQRFDAAGAPVRSQVQLSTGLVLGDRPSICVDQSNRLIAAWTFVDAFRPFEPSKIGVAARRVRPRGAPIGPEIIIAPAVANTAAAAVSCGIRNSFVVAWHADGVSSDPSDVQAQIFNRGGQPLGPPFLVNSAGTRSNSYPSIAHDLAGNFVIAWEIGTPQSFGVLARRFAPDSSSLSNEVQVATGAADDVLARPAVATLGNSGFVVVWDGSGGLFGQRFSNTAP